MSGIALDGDGAPATIVGPSPVTPPAAPAEAAAPEAPPAPVDDDADPPDAVVDASGRKLVPLEALKATRQELKSAKQLAALAEQYREAAEQGQNLGQFFQELNPLLQKLRNRPDIVANIMQSNEAPLAGPPSPYAPAPDPGEALLSKQDAEDLARTLELYTPEGAPDLHRARKLAFYMRRTGREEALGATAPFAQNMAQGQSGSLKGQYAQVRDKAGRTVNPAVLEQIWKIVPPELIAQDPNVAGILYYAARGYSAHHGLDEPAAPARTPLFTEPAGGRPPSAGGVLSEFDRAMQRATQLSDKQYTERASGYKPGAINILE